MLQVIEETSIRYDHAGPDDQKFFVVKCEWFWTRIAEGYAPEDDFLYKDVSHLTAAMFILIHNDLFLFLSVYAKCPERAS